MKIRIREKAIALSGNKVNWFLVALAILVLATLLVLDRPAHAETPLPRLTGVSITPISAHPGQTITVEVFSTMADVDYEANIEYFDGWQIQPLAKHNIFRFPACRHCAPQNQVVYIRIFVAGDYKKTVDDMVISYENTPWPRVCHLPLVLR